MADSDGNWRGEIYRREAPRGLVREVVVREFDYTMQLAHGMPIIALVHRDEAES
jgi:hypothetical protein